MEDYQVELTDKTIFKRKNVKTGGWGATLNLVACLSTYRNVRSEEIFYRRF